MKTTDNYIQRYFEFKKILFPMLIVGGVLLFSLLVGAAVALGLLKLLIVLFGGIFGIALLMLDNKLLFKIFIVTLFFSDWADNVFWRDKSSLMDSLWHWFVVVCKSL